MARIRTIKPEFPQSESMGRVSRDARGHFVKRTIPAATRREVAERYGAQRGKTTPAQCAYCISVGTIIWFSQGSRSNSHGWVTLDGLEFDHVAPEIKGGESVASNIVLACRACNRAKGPRLPSEWRA